ncbi:MAG: response regulator transcription factor [Dehalococcoidales bacterium]|nr:response regulator transcription factor [Dehalococcoidales bacterium]
MRVLVVEDEKRMANKLKRGLTEEGYSVDVTYTGEDAELILNDVAYDAIVLDVKLPGKDGISVCETIRGQKLNTPILMLTGLDSIRDRVQGLDSGADDYLTKPFDFEELYARVRALVRRNPIIVSQKIKVGDLIMEPSSRKVWLRGQALDIRGKEYEVLECLMRHPDIVVTRTMIEQRIQSIELDSDYNVVDVYICKIRAKLGSGKSMIETVRGSGYLLKSS